MKFRIIPSANPDWDEESNFLHNNEKCELFTRSHGIRLIFRLGKHWFPTTILFVIGFYIRTVYFHRDLVSDSVAEATLLFSMAMIVFLLHWLFLEIIGFFMSFMMVTNKRIVELHKTVWLREEMNEISFEQITNIHHEKTGLLQNVLNFGTLVIHSNVQKPIKVSFIGSSEEKFATVSEIHGMYIGRRINNNGQSRATQSDAPKT